nr:MAG TPA: hypothetical protein [Caudoviricetes sp.]
MASDRSRAAMPPARRTSWEGSPWQTRSVRSS